MKKGDVINGYRILEDFRIAGGMSKVSFAERDGKEYFIKEFLYPKYPTSDSPGSERIKEQKRKACETFEKHHNEINTLIKGKCSGLGGNLIYALDFFREGYSYYKVNEKIDNTSLSLKDISSLPFDKILIIATSVCQSLGILHDLRIVHGDLKPDNILIKEISHSNFSGKLIDFDDSYFSEEPPSNKEGIVGTPEYYSPELAAYVMDEEEEKAGNTLTLASDIFTLGIIFSEYFTGDKPITDSSLPTWEAIAKGKTIYFSKPLNPSIESLLRCMLSLQASDRPKVKKIHSMLRDIKAGRLPEKTDEKITSRSRSRIRIGRGFGPSKPEHVPSPKSEKITPSSFKTKTSYLRGNGLKIADK